MEASTKARNILKEVLSLDVVGDIEFVIENAKQLLDIHEKAQTGNDYEFGDNEEDFLIELSNSLLKDESVELTGPHIVLLACYLLSVETEIEQFTTRQISRVTGRGRKLSNVSATMESLLGRGQVELVNSEQGGHRLYQLTKLGRKDCETLVQSYSQNKIRLVG